MEGWIFLHDIDPVLVALGPLKVRWYGLMYFIAFLLGYLFILRMSRQPYSPIETEDVPNLLTFVILGVILGGRLGYVLFYGGWYYILAPWKILEIWKGGLSFHGGLLGFTAALWLYARSRKVPLLAVGDFVIVMVPVGLFFGRLGNFINGELFGKPTDGSWGVVFPTDPIQVPRHPSQLYEAFGEGLVIFLVLWALYTHVRRPGIQPAVFLLLYGIARFAVEFIRLPDADMGYLWGVVTMGQVLSMPMIAVGLGWTIYILTRPAADEAQAP